MRYLPLAVVGLAVGVGLLPGPSVHGCAMAPIAGQSVSVTDETALIVWDAATKTEHFTRVANFRSTSPEFGFLVPTPTDPTLTETQGNGFWQLASITAPRVIEQVVKIPASSGGCGREAKSTFGLADQAARATAPDAVQVLGEQKVGGYDAARLKAVDPVALLKWLSDHGYDARPQLKDWLKIYTDSKWVITAFKVSIKTPNDPRGIASVQGSAIRLSFTAEQPFYPYREPADARAGTPGTARSLQVFVLADEKVEPTLGRTEPAPQVKTMWAGPAFASQLTLTLVSLKLPATQKDWYLTEFEDRSSPRPGTDELYFRKSADPTPVERTPIYHTVYVHEEPNGFGSLLTAFGIGCPLGLLLAGLVVLRLIRRR